MAQLASKPGPKWGHLGPFMPLWMHFWPLRAFFYAFLCIFFCVFMNIYAFLLKINGKFSKIQKIAHQSIDFAQKDRKALKSA